MSKLTQTLIEDVLKSKEDIKRVLNENIQSVFKDVIKEGLSELLEKEDESFDDEEILSKEDNKESDTNDTEEFNDLNSIQKVEGETARDVGMRVGKKSQTIVLLEKVKKHFQLKDRN